MPYAMGKHDSNTTFWGLYDSGYTRPLGPAEKKFLDGKKVPTINTSADSELKHWQDASTV